MLLCAVTPKIFSALSELEGEVPEVGQCVLLLHSDFLGNLSSHSDPLSLSTKLMWESIGAPKAARLRLCHPSISAQASSE